MSEYERNQMTPGDVARAIMRGEYTRKNGDTSKTPEPKNEAQPKAVLRMFGIWELVTA